VCIFFDNIINGIAGNTGKLCNMKTYLFRFGRGKNFIILEAASLPMEIISIAAF
jgi:hypothetical protein